jgi:YHS domain-containing protein
MVGLDSVVYEHHSYSAGDLASHVAPGTEIRARTRWTLVSDKFSRADPVQHECQSYLSTPDLAVYSLGVIDTTSRRSPMAIETDPVCGMQVDTETTDLKFEHDGTTYWFCGKGCLLEFRDDPEKYLAPDYQPSM